MRTVHNVPTERAWLSAVIDRKLKRDLVELARQRDRSLSAEVRRALVAHLQREERVGVV